MNQKNILITGGNRGIGNGLLKIFAKEHNVVITVRDKEKGKQAIEELKGLDNILDYVVMDVDSNEMILNVREEIKEKSGARWEKGAAMIGKREARCDKSEEGKAKWAEERESMLIFALMCFRRSATQGSQCFYLRFDCYRSRV